jgi:hypothetical protein
MAEKKKPIAMPEWHEEWRQARERFNNAAIREELDGKTTKNEFWEAALEVEALLKEMERAQDAAEKARAEARRPPPTPAQERLHEAVAGNRWETIIELVEAGTAPLEKTVLLAAGKEWPDSWTAKIVRAGGRAVTPEMLDGAIRRRKRETVELLVNLQAREEEDAAEKATASDGRKPTPEMLHTAIRLGDAQTAKLLLAARVVPLKKTLRLTLAQKRAADTKMLVAANPRAAAQMLHAATAKRDWLRGYALLEAGAVPLEKTLALAAEGDPYWEGALQKALQKGAQAPGRRKTWGLRR